MRLLPNLVRKAFVGLFVRRECWTLSLKGRILLLLISTAAAISITFLIHPFLAVSQPVSGDYLIVEGWISSHAIRGAKSVFEMGKYQKILTTGPAVIDEFGAESQVTYADWGANRLIKIGVAPNMVQPIPASQVVRDRTYTSALSLKAWFVQERIPVKSLDVVTSGAHARRTRMLFQRAFGSNVKVGVISVANPGYDAKHWWRSSAGVREVLDELIAYSYAKIFIQFSGE